MNLLERVLTLLRVNLPSLVERTDNPEKALQQLQLDMRNQLVQVKTETARSIAEKHLLQKKLQATSAEAATWYKKAEQAVLQGDDNAAREALSQYNAVNKHAQRYQQQKQTYEQTIQTFRSVLGQLDEKIAEVDLTLQNVALQKRNSILQQKVIAALQKNRNSKNTDSLSTAQAEESELPVSEKRERPGPIQASTPVTGKRPGARRVETGQLTATENEPSTERDLDLAYLKKILDVPQSQE